jgi:hypothetical protein
MANAGYSGTPLAKKLGLKEGQAALLIAVPESLYEIAGFEGFAKCVRAAKVTGRLAKGPFDYIHIFATDADAFAQALPELEARLTPDGMIWVSWPKKASKVATTLDENTIRNFALALRLVDVKVCAVDEIWSGLKLVIRKSLR